MFNKILIANRGEVAVRIIRACREMGIETVAVYSKADEYSLHVMLADEKVCIGENYAKNSYLNKDAILTAALEKKCGAIHPGYGMLSENSDFASMCEKENIKFIGPNSETIRNFGNKIKACKLMKEQGLDIIKGVHINLDLETAKKKANEIGYPLIIKAVNGGGGKGIRIVYNRSEFDDQYHKAFMEAKEAFGDGTCYLEKYIAPCKHVEFQIIADKNGNVVCLGERDCSVQNNNQKLIEESPISIFNEKKRQKIYKLITKIIKQIKYENVGTVEFLMDKKDNLYFLEMNTRLQVEHAVTEMISGIDLVKWQIRIAAGLDLNFTQNDITTNNSYCIESRINALSTNGEISKLHVPNGMDVRFDSALYQGYKIPPFYDSMIAKLITKGKTRDEVIRKMKAALTELVIEGIKTNQDYLLEILSSQEFISGKYTTNLIEILKKGNKNV